MREWAFEQKKNKRQSFFILILSMINRCTLNRTGQRLTVSIRFKVILGKKNSAFEIRC